MESAKNVATLSPQRRLVGALTLTTLVAVGLLFLRFVVTDSLTYAYLLPNLMLGLVPLVFAWLLRRSLARKRPRKLLWRAEDWLLFICWLLFVPNSFYLLTDFIHLGEAGAVSTYDVVMHGSFTFIGFLIGYLTLLYMHRLLDRRFGLKPSRWFVILILWLVSFAMYLGRDVRLNSWDLAFDPLGLLLGLNYALRPSQIVATLGNTLLYFSLLGPLYLVARSLQALDQPRN